MGEWLASAKLTWACSAHMLDAIDAIHLSAEQQALLARIPDPMMRQLVRDFCVNQQFRRDYWVKGARRMTPLEQMEVLRAERVVLVQPRADVALKVTGVLGEATLQEAVYAPLLDLLADHKPKTLGQLEAALGASHAGKTISFAHLLQAVLVLTGSGALAPAQDDAAIAKAKKATERLNAHLMTKSRGSTDIGYLASPVTGGAVSVPRFHQLFLLAKLQGHKTPPEWASFVWQLLAAQGQRLLKDGQALQTPEENLAELNTQAQTFAEKHWPILKALQVA